jgi:hypothetical protein
MRLIPRPTACSGRDAVREQCTVISLFSHRHCSGGDFTPVSTAPPQILAQWAESPGKPKAFPESARQGIDDSEGIEPVSLFLKRPLYFEVCKKLTNLRELNSSFFSSTDPYYTPIILRSVKV